MTKIYLKRDLHVVVVTETIEKQVLVWGETEDELREHALQLVNSHGPYMVVGGGQTVTEMRPAAAGSEMVIW